MKRRHLPVVLGSVQDMCGVCAGAGSTRVWPVDAPELAYVMPCLHCQGLPGGRLGRRRLPVVLPTLPDNRVEVTS